MVTEISQQYRDQWDSEINLAEESYAADQIHVNIPVLLLLVAVKSKLPLEKGICVWMWRPAAKLTRSALCSQPGH